MSLFARLFVSKLLRSVSRCSLSYSTKPVAEEDEYFRVLYLRNRKTTGPSRKQERERPAVLPPRSETMKVDQDWGSVWPGPRTFHPATVPLPLRQGYTERGAPPPDRFGNAELMKIPNFLHLTPPVIKRQCEALKKFCTSWPKELHSDEECNKHFQLEVISSTYCHSSVTIRDPMARIVTIKFRLGDLKLTPKAKDKCRRLLDDRYDEESDVVTIVTDRCPMQKQNYDYAMYLLTAIYHESNNEEPWEKLKSEADMECYVWEDCKSRISLENLFGKSYKEVENAEQYVSAVSSLMNEGESEYTLRNYGDSVRKLLGIPGKRETLRSIQGEVVEEEV